MQKKSLYTLTETETTSALSFTEW